ncbi:MFS transporter [Psychromicrobium xiongbiense]|uniref:MFS transporter n=1 Tax=Psychromicrobium xiongbiense TaxID=3051184 RepID=UPI0025558CD2|nr:MFS transporter [Psychromicrobium sp. YIM S02556]
MLSYASARTGRGSAFGVHQAPDQTGAMLGPLLLATILSWKDGDYRPAFATLAVPGVLVLALLFWLRHRVPDPRVNEEGMREAVPHDASPAVAIVLIVAANAVALPGLLLVISRLPHHTA